MGNFIFGGGSKSLNKGGLLVSPAVKSSSALSFVLQPQSKTVDEYALATFSCEVTGGIAPYTYQWKKNGTNIGTNSANLSFTAADTDKNASITVVVTDSAGAVIASTPAALGVTSYVYQLDGVTQQFNLSAPIALIAGNTVAITVGFGGATSSYRTIFDSPSAANRTTVRTLNGNWDIIGGTITVDGVTAANGSPAPTSGFSRVVFTSSVSGSVSIIGNNYASSALGNFKIYKLDVVGGVNSSIPLNNKSQGANQLATVGSINATIVNYNAAGWTAI